MADANLKSAVDEVLAKAGAKKTGFGNHDYRAIDPSTINVDEYATSLRGDEEHFGDVREYNSAFNTKHPENDTTLDTLGRLNTIIETDAPGYEGKWIVTDMPAVKAPTTYAVLSRVDDSNEPIPDTQQTVSCVDLGCAVDEQNYFPQIRTKVVLKGRVGREQRERLTKKN